MTDDDMATLREEQDRERALLQRRPEGPVACGVCLNCGEPVSTPGVRWCDADCRADWEARQAR